MGGDRESHIGSDRRCRIRNGLGNSDVGRRGDDVQWSKDSGARIVGPRIESFRVTKASGAGCVRVPAGGGAERALRARGVVTKDRVGEGCPRRIQSAQGVSNRAPRFDCRPIRHVHAVVVETRLAAAG